jgi:hypothetical protein
MYSLRPMRSWNTDATREHLRASWEHSMRQALDQHNKALAQGDSITAATVYRMNHDEHAARCAVYEAVTNVS